MTCPIHQETHEMYANMFFELLSPSNYSNWMEDYENSDQYDRQGRKMGEKSKEIKNIISKSCPKQIKIHVLIWHFSLLW